MPGEDDSRIRALVRGRVQGVLFRDFTRRHAQRLGLVGWVRNLSDGRTVEAVAQGPSATLDEFVRVLRSGPPGAGVEDV